MEVIFHYIIAVITGSWAVLGQMSPYLLFGFFAAGILSIVLSPQWLERHLGGRGPGPVLKSATFGVPLPLCSCGVIPVTASLRRHGASRGATLAFLLSTPSTGVDSILATYALLGPVFAAFRALAAFLTGIIGGGIATFVADDRNGSTQTANGGQNGCQEACCSAESKKQNIVRRVLEYGFLTLPKDIAKPLLIGIGIAGIIGAVVEQGAFSSYLGGGFGSMLIMMVVGVPIYVCATASIPLAVGFMHMGASPGAALVFLIAGPATNAATISVVWKLLGRRTAIIYLLTVGLGALASGWTLDAVYTQLGGMPAGLSGHAHAAAEGGWFAHAAAIALLAVLFGSQWASRRPHRHEHPAEGHTHDSETLSLRIKGMTCGHCANAVSQALGHVAGVTGADIDLQTGQATVHGEHLDPDILVQAVETAGYQSAVVEG